MADEVLEQPTKEIQHELGCQKWLFKITERLMVVLDCIKNKTDIKQEEDWQVIEMLHADWFFGRHIFYETLTVPDLTKSATQPNLFDKTSESDTDFTNIADRFYDAKDKLLNGTVSDIPFTKPKKKRK
jgi:hypothetical protein